MLYARRPAQKKRAPPRAFVGESDEAVVSRHGTFFEEQARPEERFHNHNIFLDVGDADAVFESLDTYFAHNGGDVPTVHREVDEIMREEMERDAEGRPVEEEEPDEEEARSTR